MENLNREEILHLIPQLKKGCIILAIIISAGLVGKDAFYLGFLGARETAFSLVPIIFVFFYWIQYKLDEPYLLKRNISVIDALIIILTLLPLSFLYSGFLLFFLYACLTTKVLLFQVICGLYVFFITSGQLVLMGTYLPPIFGLSAAVVLIYFRNQAVNKVLLD